MDVLAEAAGGGAAGGALGVLTSSTVFSRSLNCITNIGIQRKQVARTMNLHLF